MEEDEVQSLFNLEEPHVTESDKIKLRLKKFCFVIGILLILWVISIIIIISNNSNNNSNSNSDNNQEEPSPDTQDDSFPKDESYIKAEKFIANLTYHEIICLLNGKNNINNINENDKRKLCEGQISPFNSSLYPNEVFFKGMCIQDGTTGVSFSKGKGILWQSEINTAATFNQALMYKIGKAQGAESKEKGINTLLSPSVNIMKRPQYGILWESFGDDPFYSGVCASKIIKGIQESGVIATIKHFLGNDIDEDRISNYSNININALMDIYVEPFYRAINEEDVRGIMAGNNTLNNFYCYENEYLLNNILRKNLNFKGFIISDLWNVYNKHNYNCSLLDLNMQEECTLGPSNKVNKNDTFERNESFCSPSEEYIKNKTDIDERFKESAKRIIAAMYKMNQMEGYPEVDLYKEATIKESEERIKIQIEAAKESLVLLKNDDKILPLNKYNNFKNFKNIGIIGNIAIEKDCIIEEQLKYINGPKNEDILLEYDSKNTKFNCLLSPLEEIQNLAENEIQFFSPIKLIYNENKMENENFLKVIEKWIKKFQMLYSINAFIVFAIATSGDKYIIAEKIDGNRIYLMHGKINELINKISKIVKENIIVVINAPSLDNLPWINKVKAVIFSGFPGDGASNAIAKILYGNESPSGHLPFTWGKFEDNKRYNYPDGLFIGQRWFNKNKNSNKYIFPFGFGLSYTNFSYSKLNISISEDGLTAEFTIKNIGPYKGQAVPMMFLSFPDSIGDYPEYIFKGFNKTKLKPNEEKRVTIHADDHALSYFKDNKYVRVNNGIIKVYIAENGNITDSKLNLTINAI